VLLAGKESLAAVHAGWRGLVAGVIPATLETLSEEAETFTAWIGPAIGACCYEVGEEVAQQVVEASDLTVRKEGGKASGKPHLDLQQAAEVQLRKLGLTEVRRVAACTRCEDEALFSYRREGPGEGRNRALIWRTP